MKNYPIEHIASIINGNFLNKKINASTIEHLLFDSRQVNFPESSLFFAIEGERRDGHDFILDLYKKGVRNFIVEKKINRRSLRNANCVLVENSIHALQSLTTFHRNQYSIPIVAITGSNGKTIVKEWLKQLLEEDTAIIASPKSYNSQIGVPLSIWQMNSSHEIGVFEAGISRPEEMSSLEKIIQPSIGILTNIGDAHNEGFKSINQKIKEKIHLFQNCDTIIYCKDDERISSQINVFSNKKLFSWSKKTKASLQIIDISKSQTKTELKAIFQQEQIQIAIPFTDGASIENAIHCWAFLLFLKKNNIWIQKKFLQLSSIEMRLEIKKGINNCIIINDSYNADLASLEIALNYLEQQQNQNSATLVLSDFLQAGLSKKKLYSNIAYLISLKKISKVIGIGIDIFSLKKQLPNNTRMAFFRSTSEFLKKTDTSNFNNENILLKGARIFSFEKIADRLSQKKHKTILEVNLDALIHNLNIYSQFLHPSTKLIAMVKASAYGSGSVEVAKILEQQNVDYLAVAYADEGVELRNAGIQLPILVLNPEEAAFETLKSYQLEPEVYSLELLKKLTQYFPKEKIKIHLKLDTGMHRLGFEYGQLDELLNILSTYSNLEIQSIFSHLSASEAREHDSFSHQQVERFKKMYRKIITKIKSKPLRHILNSSGIHRFPKYQMDMVRLGIGLYGIDSNTNIQQQLQNVLTLKATISQIKKITRGETIGYSRKGQASSDMRIATISIGYADGLLRGAGNGNFKVIINGQSATIIGNICMDMCMVDISKIDEAQEGDEVTIFGNNPSVKKLAVAMNTIPYEVFTGISDRVKRIYFRP